MGIMDILPYRDNSVLLCRKEYRLRLACDFAFGGDVADIRRARGRVRHNTYDLLQYYLFNRIVFCKVLRGDDNISLYAVALRYNFADKLDTASFGKGRGGS